MLRAHLPANCSGQFSALSHVCISCVSRKLVFRNPNPYFTITKSKLHVWSDSWLKRTYEENWDNYKFILSKIFKPIDTSITNVTEPMLILKQTKLKKKGALII